MYRSTRLDVHVLLVACLLGCVVVATTVLDVTSGWVCWWVRDVGAPFHT